MHRLHNERRTNLEQILLCRICCYGNTDPFWMDNMYCSGGEKNLTDCRFDGWGMNDCHESEAAGVICRTGPGLRYVAAESTTTTTTTAAPPLEVVKKPQGDMVPRLRIKVNR